MLRELFILLAVCVLFASNLLAQSVGNISARSVATNGSSLSTVLGPDGSVRPNITGSFDPSGYRLTYGPNGEPRFVSESRSVGNCTPDAWDTTFKPNGANDDVNAIVSDGLGNLYFGGSFTAVQGIPIGGGIAKWNGTAWSALGSGVLGTVNSIGILGTDVYVGGNIVSAGGIPVRNVAKWNGNSWSALGAGLGGGTHVVEVVAVLGNDVYFGGNFNTADGSPANGFVRWNGTSYSTLGPGLFGQVYTIAVSGGNLYVGGFVHVVGDPTTGGLLKWDGVSWSGFGLTASSTTVNSIGFRGEEIFVGGTIRISTTLNTQIARWNGTAWTPLGFFSTNLIVRAFAFLGTDVYAGGNFERRGGVGIGNGVLKYNGTQWSAIGNGTEFGEVRSIYASGNTFYVGGDFEQAGDAGARNIATLTDGTTWAQAFPGTGPDNSVSAIAVWGTDIYIGGTFRSAGPVAAHRIAKWNSVTNTWSALGTALSGFTSEHSYISAIAVVGNKVYAGGSFENIGGIFTNNIAVWNGANWSAMATGVNGPVTSIITQGEDIYVGGAFSSAGGVAANRVARWDGTTWSGLNSAIVPNTVSGMALMGSDLYVSTFTTAAANPAYFSKYNGTTWTALGADLGDRGVSSIAVIGTDVYVAGGFTQAAAITVNRIAKWNGISWSALGNGLPQAPGQIGSVRLGVSGSNLIAVGDFTVASGGPANHAAKWNGTAWSPLGAGTDVPATVVMGAGGDIFVGGSFSTAGCNQSPYLARWRETVWTGSTSTDWHTSGNWGGGSIPVANAGVTISSNNASISSADVSVSSLIIAGGRTLTVASGRTLTVNGVLDVSNGTLGGPGTLIVNGDLRLNGGTVSGMSSVMVNGNLYLVSGTIAGTGPVNLTACRTSAVSGGSAIAFVNSPLTRCVNSAGTYRFPVGSNGIYAPVELSSVSGSGNFTVEPKTGSYAGAAAGLPANRLNRWWNTSNAGIAQGDLTFTYADSEVVGLEARYKVFAINGGSAQVLTTGLNTTSNRASVVGVTSFSAFTMADGPSTPQWLNGRVRGASGRGAHPVFVLLTDSSGNVRWAKTNPFGYYRFPNVMTWETYTISVRSKRYSFSDDTQTFLFPENAPDVIFTATDH